MTVESDSSPAVGGSAWPPGFRFHPTDEELVLYYLKRKICRKKLRLNIIADLDVYKWDPEELPGHSLLKTGDRQWYFFSARDRKYPNGARSNRATRQGYWKATGKDRIITSNRRSVGLKKTLVFYKGRAPSGQRTDWVMHEYTLDEEEFMRCQNVKDYYALYKVYKKSGPGPKNGEQYGAPFREEEWADDETDILKSTGLEIHPPDIPEVTSFDNITENNNFQPPPDDLEDLLNELFVPEPEFEQALLDDASPVPVPSLPVNEPVQSSLIVPSAPEVFSEPVNLLSPIPQYDLSESIDWTLSGISGCQQSEASLVTFAPQNYTLEDQSSGDFLEIYDLLGPEPSLDTMEKPVEKLSFDEVTGLSELDQFHDANMFLRDIGPMDQGINDVNLLDYGMENQCNYQLQQSLLLPADLGISQLWALDQRNNDVFSSVESVQGYQHRPSGFVNASSSLLNDATRNQNGVEATGPMSRFSSAVWSFVESIPTNPASASESALVNRALERMSSFSRVRINSMSSNVGAVSGAAVVRSRKSRGFVFFYVVGVLGALLGVLVGFLRLWQRSVPA